jgi:hypothetical protein
VDFGGKKILWADTGTLRRARTGGEVLRAKFKEALPISTMQVQGRHMG